jgi:hypothetical protein
MNSELFIELSEEQQEVVAGGGQLLKAGEQAKTYLDIFNKASSTRILKSVGSGVNGSYVNVAVANDYEEMSLDTGALENSWLIFD